LSRPAYRIELTRAATRGLAALSARDRERVARVIDALALTPRPAGATALRGGPGLLRVRVGDFRVVYRVDDNARTVLIVRIGNRREVCRGI